MINMKVPVRIIKPLIDLVIVITGVSVAFLLSSMNERSKEKSERNKVLSSLHHELQNMTKIFPSMADYQAKRNISWDSLLALGQTNDFYQYYYLQPQHNYSVLEYAIDARNVNVVDFALHQKLLELHKHIKMLEQAEVYMTSIALNYQAEKEPGLQVSPHNLFHFKRFIGFAKNRANQLRYIGKLAEETLPLVEPNR